MNEVNMNKDSGKPYKTLKRVLLKLKLSKTLICYFIFILKTGSWLKPVKNS